MSNTINPVRETNAIDEIAFVILFEKEIGGQNFDCFDSLKDELKDDLPIVSPINIMQVSIDQQGVKVPLAKLGGVVYSKKSSIDESRLEWSLRIETKSIVVGCTDFTKSEEIRLKIIRFLKAAVDKMDLNENPIIEVAYQCVDKFSGNDAGANYCVNDVFNTNSIYLTPKIAGSEFTAWHMHQGWFDDSESFKMLNNLNLNAYEPSNGSSFEVVISHLIKIRKIDKLNLPAMDCLKGIDDLEGYLDSAFRLSHGANKKILKDLLVPVLLEKICLS